MAILKDHTYKITNVINLDEFLGQSTAFEQKYISSSYILESQLKVLDDE